MNKILSERGIEAASQALTDDVSVVVFSETMKKVIKAYLDAVEAEKELLENA